jgi:hypothetical protein
MSLASGSANEAKSQSADEQEREPQQDGRTPRSFNLHKNLCLAVNKLPPELLCQIFHLSQVKLPASNADVINSWANFSHVCTVWRSIALNTPKLWSTLSLAKGP